MRLVMMLLTPPKNKIHITHIDTTTVEKIRLISSILDIN